MSESRAWKAMAPGVGARAAHEQPAPEDAGDLSVLPGTWLSACGDGVGIVKVVVTQAAEGGYSLRAFGAVGSERVDWGETELIVHVAGRGQIGFHASYDFGAVRAHLAANHKLGVLVIQTFTSFHDGSGRAGWIERGFYAPERRPARALGGGRMRAQRAVAADLLGFAGVWRNTSGSPLWLAGLEVFRSAGVWRMRGRAVSAPFELGAAVLRVYPDNMGYVGFKGEYRLAGRRVVVAANTQKELIVITSFHCWGRGADGRNQVRRELFCREPNGQGVL